MNRSRWTLLLVVVVAACFLWSREMPRVRGGDDRGDFSRSGGSGAGHRMAREPALDSTFASTIEVRDLADGTPVADLALRCRSSSGSIDVRTNAHGRVVLPRACSRVTALQSEWQVLTRRPGDPPGVAWVWRTVRIHGTVRSADPGRTLPWKAVELTARYGGPAHDNGVPTPPPWLWTWLRERGMPIRTDLGKPRPDGSFDVAIPRVRGYGLRASAPGWEVAWTVPAVDAHTTETAVVLSLRPAVHLSGIVRDPDGGPARGVYVCAYVVRRGRRADFSSGHLYVELEDAFTASWQRDEDRARVTAAHRVLTRDDGTFELPLKVRGDVWLVVYGPGRASLDRHLGPVEADRAGLDVTLQPGANGPDARVRVYEGEKPLANQRLTLADLTVEDTQPAVRLDTDAAGRVPADWLRPGRRYFLAAIDDSGYLRAQFLWSGQRVIRLSRVDPNKYVHGRRTKGETR